MESDAAASIGCSDIGDDGIGSSYIPHTFTLSNSEVTAYEWKFYLKNIQGDYQLVSTDTATDFTIDKITPSDYLYINANGDFEGRIECSYTENETERNAAPFLILLEQKPIIISIDNFQRVDIENNGFYLTFDVHYLGADYIDIEIEEDYNVYIRSYRIEEPNIAHVKTGNMSSLYYSWVTIKVSNKYGSVSKEFEFAPKFTEIDNIEIFNRAILYDINGNIVYDGSMSQLSDLNIAPGVYIKKEYDNDGNINTSKIIVR